MKNDFQVMVAQRMATMSMCKARELKRTKAKLNNDDDGLLKQQTVPPFIKTEFLTQHSFTIEGNTYEFRDGKFYMKTNQIIEAGEAFGESALLKRGKRLATVKAELNCEFASLHYTNIKKSLTKIDDDYMTPKIHFLQNT